MSRVASTSSSEAEDLRVRLAEAEEMLRAIRCGSIDALVVDGEGGPRIFALQGLDAESSRARGEMLQFVSDAVVAVGIDGTLDYVNPATEKLFGISASTVLGRRLVDIPSLQFIDKIIRSFVIIPEEWRGEIVKERAGLDSRTLEVTVTSIGGENNQSTGALVILRDVSSRRRDEQGLRAAKDTFQTLIERSPFGVYVVDADFRIVLVGQGARKTFENVDPLIGRDFAEAMHILWPEPFASHAIERFRHTLKTGETYHAPSTIERRNDTREVEAYDWKIERLILPDGRFGVVCHFYDLSERQHFETVLREKEERLRLATDAAGIGIWMWEPEQDSVVWENDWPYRLFGVPAGEEPVNAARFVNEFVDPGDRLAFEEAISRTINRREDLFFEGRFRRRDGEMRFVQFKGRPTEGSTTNRVLGTARDITERKEREQQIQLLMGEVNHRAKNLLGVVQAIARQAPQGSPEEFVSGFSARIQSLAASHDLLVSSNWQGADLDSLVRSQLAHLSDLLGKRIFIDVVPMQISASVAQSIGMILHELATNAVKYGALSNAVGTVVIFCDAIDGPDGQKRFQMQWTERGGPPVMEPARRGFGSAVTQVMAERALSAKVTRTFSPEGLEWRLECALDSVQEQKSQ